MKAVVEDFHDGFSLTGHRGYSSNIAMGLSLPIIRAAYSVMSEKGGVGSWKMEKLRRIVSEQDLEMHMRALHYRIKWYLQHGGQS